MEMERSRLETGGPSRSDTSGVGTSGFEMRKLEDDGRTNAPMRRSVGLSWFSIGLGAALIAAPRRTAALIGARPNRRTRATMFAVGLREIASGVGLLTKRRPAAWLWTRVAGDIMDLALLGRALVSRKTNTGKIMGAIASVSGVAILDAATAVDATRMGSDRRASAPIHVTRAITVNRPREQVYQFWRNFENLPRFMAHLESVKSLDGRSQWRARGPAGMTVQWEAQVVSETPPEMLAWRSMDGADVPNEGEVRFYTAPGGRGTEVHVDLRYWPPAGAVGKTFGKLFGREPSQQIEGDLRRFKQVMETGDVVHSDASIHAGRHPARSPEAVERQDGRLVAR